MQINSDPLHVEKHLLSLSSCGCYINTQDIVEIGNALGIELPYKKRSLILQTLLLHAREHNQNLALLTLLCELLDRKNQALSNMLQNYPKAGFILQNFIFKTNTTKLLLQRELALHVKENDDA